MALMLVADEIASRLFWPTERPLAVQDVSAYLCGAHEVDVAERAYQFVLNTIAENNGNFSNSAKQVWGSLCGPYAYINKTVLCRIMSVEGFEFDAVKAKWVDRGYIECNSQGRYHHVRTVNGVRAQHIKIKLAPEEGQDDSEAADDCPV
jgi:hypothetical protein